MLRLETSNSNVRSSVYTYPVDLRNGRACALEEGVLRTAEAEKGGNMLRGATKILILSKQRISLNESESFSLSGGFSA